MKISVEYYNHSPVFIAACEIVRKLKDAGFKAFFVGGAVRDMLLGKTPADIDIATSALPEQTATLFLRSHQVGASFGVTVVTIGKYNFEVATLREEREYADGRHPEILTYTDDHYLDANRRDFTINSMFYDPYSDEIFDFFDGTKDLANGYLRCVGEPMVRFQEDYLRMLRAVRFAARFGLHIDPAIIRAIGNLKEKVLKLSAERIRNELNTMLTGPHPAAAVKLLDELHLLELILPEVSALRGVEQPPQFHPEGDVFTHTMLMLEHMKYPSIELAWSVLLHDVGKPRAYSTGADGSIHFYGHENFGAGMANNIMTRFRFSTAETENVVNAVKNHMRFAVVNKMRKSNLARLMAAPGFKIELELHRLDALCSNRLMNNFVFLLDKIAESGGEVSLPPPLLNGRDLIAIGFKPGPKIGKTLLTIQNLQLEGKISDRESALKIARNL